MIKLNSGVVCLLFCCIMQIAVQGKEFVVQNDVRERVHEGLSEDEAYELAKFKLY